MATPSTLDESPPYVNIPLQRAPAALQQARPGDRVKVEGTIRVTTISEDSVSGEFLDIESEGEGAMEEEDEEVDLSDSAVEKKKVAEKGEGNKNVGGIASLAAKKPA